jgi:hypothetical protein
MQRNFINSRIFSSSSRRMPGSSDCGPWNHSPEIGKMAETSSVQHPASLDHCVGVNKRVDGMHRDENHFVDVNKMIAGFNAGRYRQRRIAGTVSP